MKGLELDGIGKSLPVKLKGRDNDKFTLREMSGADRADYLSEMRSKADENGMVNDLRGLQENLVSRCLFDDGSGKKVTDEFAGELPAGTLEALFKAAQELNGITAKAEEVAEKN